MPDRPPPSCPGLTRRRTFLTFLGRAAAAGLLASRLRGAEDAPRPAHRPNVVLIMADDLGYGEVGCYPQIEPIRTPNIDRIARRGVRFTQGYSADPMCWPSRGSLLTGRYHERWRSSARVPTSETMIGRYLRPAGYATGCVGKWHNTGSIGVWDGKPGNHPHGRGFDEFFGFLGGMHDYFDADLGTHFKQGANRPHEMPVYDGTERVPKVKYLTDEFSDRAVAFIRRHRAEPFLLFLSYTAKHTPLQAPKEYLDRNGGDVNAAMIDAMDTGVGRILDTLDGLGLAENTMVWFIGDNGGWPGPNWHLRGKKGTLFEGGLRVPFLVAWPGGLPKAVTYEHPVQHIDVMPTILAAAGAEVSGDRDLDGVNLLASLRGETAEPPHETLFWCRHDARRFAVRRGQWKLVREVPERDAPPVAGLFDLEKDAAETRNLLARHRAVADDLLARYAAWLRTIGRDVPAIDLPTS
jgi:arylsulfatase A-like enzyme